MSLKQQIQKDFQEAFRKSDPAVKMTLSLLSAAIQNREKEKRYKIAVQNPDLSGEELEKMSGLEDEEVQEVVSSEAKKRKEAILAFAQAGRKEQEEKENTELGILEKYLPEQASDEEIESVVKEAIEKTGASGIKDIGKIMAEAMPRMKGRADGSRVGEKAKTLLS